MNAGIRCRNPWNTIAPLTLLLTSLPAMALEQNLLVNGQFDNSTANWSLSGNVGVGDEGWEDDSSLRLVPQPGITAQAVQRVYGLEPQTRYTIAARVRSSSNLVPPILAVRNGAQIDKATGWIAIDDQNKWIEQRFEIFTGKDQTAVDVTLQAWKTELEAVVMFDDIRFCKGRIEAPTADPGEADFPTAPPITTAPGTGDNIITNGDLSDESGRGWALGIEASIVDVDGQPAFKLLSTADTSRVSQPIQLALPPDQVWKITAEAKVDPGVISNLYVTSNEGLLANLPISSTSWQSIEIPVETGENWTSNLKLTLENWKNQPGSAWFRNIRWEAIGGEWSPTTDQEPVPQLEVLEDDFSSGLSKEDWLISTKSWGGDNGGVSPLNVSIIDDVDNGVPIKALRLQANGDLYDGDIEHNGRQTRVGAAIATRQYYASGRYEVRAKVAPELGAVTAFWPFHYIDYQKAEQGYWHEPNPRRNTEIDWEFPTDLRGTGEEQAALYGIDPEEIAFTNARTNSWGGQFGGEGGEHKGRRVLHDAEGNIVDLAQDSANGIYHTYTIEWHSGSDLGDDGDTRDQVGCVRWYFDDILIDELLDVEFGQGNVPFRAARFWIGVWFAAAGYGDEVGWGGSPNFDETSLDIAWVRIEPFGEPRDTWVRETVPNIEWATPDQYPGDVEVPDCPSDLDGNQIVDVVDLLDMLGLWGQPEGDVTGDGQCDVVDVLALIADWGPCA